ncbi:MAG TPA: isocitrate dehydrogenase (NADP(+)) [Candidatus Polarisedimenticolia bacterium]|jgi:isocitrate dehydrogenase|nr:isocitrate dehydrogenase (NADP(+)) [Candidatus Polarisedimenticolia bacterium]
MQFEKLHPPIEGNPLRYEEGRCLAPPDPIIPFIEGDGVGPEIVAAARRVLDAAVARAYEGERRLVWFEVFAGGKAWERYGEWLPQDTLDAVAHYGIAFKGPLTTPVGGGFKSLNSTLRQELDLYACLRPVRWFPGAPSPMKHPERIDLAIFRENTEDVYAGIEWREKTGGSRRVIEFLNREMGCDLPAETALGIKPMSARRSQALVRRALRHALEHGRPSVTLVHKGNIMKFTEGAFRDWGYAVAREEFGDLTVTEEDAPRGTEGPDGRVVIKDRILDSMFQQLMTRPEDYSVLATTNLNGDYLSYAAAGLVGGLGLAPSVNLGDELAVFEATHGTAAAHAGRDDVNPGALILSGGMLLEHLGWEEAARLVVAGVRGAVASGHVTSDLARQMEEARTVRCSEFAGIVIERMQSV